MASKPSGEKGGKGKGGAKGDGGVYEEPDGSFRAIVYINGKPIKRRAPTREAAEALRKSLLAQRDKGIDVGSGGQTYEAWLITWQEIKAKKWGPRSRENNRRLVDGYIVPLVGNRQLNKIRAHHLQDFIDQVQEDIVESSGGRFTGGRTVQALAQILQASFDLALRRRLIEFNPMDGVEVPEHTSVSPKPLNESHLRAFLAVAIKHPLAALWFLYALLGLRRGEGLGVRWQDVDLDAGTINIQQQVQEIEGKLAFTDPKYKSFRLLPLPAVAVELLRELKLAQMTRRLKRANTWVDHDLVFCSKDGKPLWPRNIDDDFYMLRDTAGAPSEATLHSLRHTFATLLDEENPTLSQRKGIMGHAKTTVSERYVTPPVAALRRLIDAVAERALRKAA